MLTCWLGPGASTPGITHHTTAPVDRDQSPVRCLAQPATPFPPGETVMGVQPDSAVRVIRKISEYEPGERLAWEFGLQARIWVSWLCGQTAVADLETS